MYARRLERLNAQSEKQTRCAGLAARCAAIAVLMSLAGCAPSLERETPVYPVFWNTREDKGAGLYIYATLSPPSAKSEDGKSTLRLAIWNHTGRDIFLARIGEYPGKNLWYEVRYEGGAWAAGTGFLEIAGYTAPFNLIVSTSYPKQPFVYNKSMCVVVKCAVGSSRKARYADVDLKFPLFYYAMGAMSPAWINVKHTLRLTYREAETEAEAAPVRKDEGKAAP